VGLQHVPVFGVPKQATITSCPGRCCILVNKSHLAERHDTKDTVKGMNLKLNNKKTEKKCVGPTGRYFLHIGHK